MLYSAGRTDTFTSSRAQVTIASVRVLMESRQTTLSLSAASGEEFRRTLMAFSGTQMEWRISSKEINTTDSMTPPWGSTQATRGHLLITGLEYLTTSMTSSGNDDWSLSTRHKLQYVYLLLFYLLFVLEWDFPVVIRLTGRFEFIGAVSPIIYRLQPPFFIFRRKCVSFE